MSNKQPVTVIGLGPMGQAMVNVFLEKGHEVTLWNRTASRADDLVAKGAVLASSVEEAVKANDLVILSLTDYDVMYTVLEPAVSALPGRVVVNLSSDTPEKTRAGARWIAEHGGVHITGGVTVPPSGIGSSESKTFYSGPLASFEQHKATLEVLTSADYRGEEAGLAALMYQIGMAMFWPSMVSYWQAIALADANGLKAADILSHANDTMVAMPGFLGFYADRIDSGNHAGDVDRLAMGLASVEHVQHTIADAGVDTSFQSAVVDLFRRGIEAGHENDSFSSLLELLRKK
ncbi:NAD(P)-binding domain-containing protein [Streptomyces sp. SID3212]|uniref:NAD(P)-dependent oxidoreductase n=1 Tax=unclassified Streptomyces TaxID=2593676 RepID=UPI00136E5CF8|nr:NAD(P)-binding domain-containing protein [Streptomyces sp. SID3212]MYV51524.1 NAD(P)-binding domain-containing protein [Streptomyces sp. SID3212]